MKLCSVVLFVAFTLFQGFESLAQSHNQEWGTKGRNDEQLYREIITKEHSFMRVITEDVSYVGSNHTIITYIKATDQYTNDNGGYITLLSGGVGYENVTLHIKSQRNHGFNFIIEIFGH